MEDSLKLLTNYLQDVLEQPDTAALRLEDLAPDFRELGEKAALLAETVQDLTNQLQQKFETLELENQVLMEGKRFLPRCILFRENPENMEKSLNRVAENSGRGYNQGALLIICRTREKAWAISPDSNERGMNMSESITKELLEQFEKKCSADAVVHGRGQEPCDQPAARGLVQSLQDTLQEKVRLLQLVIDWASHPRPSISRWRTRTASSSGSAA